MTTLGTFSRKNFPRVSYITVLDFYIAICFVFCFCALMEFAVLNFLTYNRMKAHASPKLRHVRVGMGVVACRGLVARTVRLWHMGGQLPDGWGVTRSDGGNQFDVMGGLLECQGQSLQEALSL